jgi:hypothetical protein
MCNHVLHNRRRIFCKGLAFFFMFFAVTFCDSNDRSIINVKRERKNMLIVFSFLTREELWLVNITVF